MKTEKLNYKENNMKYIVTRTSNYSNNEPCEEAVVEAVHYLTAISKSYCKDNPDFLERIEVTEERDAVYVGYFKDPNEVWVIELPDLEALNDFTEKYGECIIRQRSLVIEGYKVIEIYDTYRE